MEIRDVKPFEIEPVRQFLCANGWAHRVGNADEFAALVRASQRTAVAIGPAGEVLGFARAITDGMSNGYLSMVAVSPFQRRKGIGRRLVGHIIGSNSDITWVLRAGRDGASEFFEALGFTVSTIAMERSRA
ncbi:MAG TPA: GNAT family N-acetyltransferase [Noviherbaspirillum sp.]|uniref:GNAT family N-acetyltransferase n=1 Tax=Noviherbaspirillum sp. TaxID=1926288 RepID=UPI002DDD0354|nr:GNAT family N-acetyltransferase [Noviherbaspirillum sp.]HEV2610221.1 GNAT family N-acetyltransferase [Noviherbaspirillum sp.]